MRVKSPDIPSVTDGATGMWCPTCGELSQHSHCFLEWGALPAWIRSSLLGMRAYRGAGQHKSVPARCASSSAKGPESPLHGWYHALNDQITKSFLLSLTPHLMQMVSLFCMSSLLPSQVSFPTAGRTDGWIRATWMDGWMEEIDERNGWMGGWMREMDDDGWIEGWMNDDG